MPKSTRGALRSKTFDELYRAHARGLLGFLCARLGDADWAEDVLQDVFLACLRSPRPIPLEQSKAYLFRIAERLSLNALRDRAADQRKEVGQAARQADFVPVSGADPLLAQAAREALAALPREECDVVALRVFAELTFEEIAALLGAPMTTVYKRHARGMEALRRALDAGAGGRR